MSDDTLSSGEFRMYEYPDEEILMVISPKLCSSARIAGAIDVFLDNEDESGYVAEGEEGEKTDIKERSANDGDGIPDVSQDVDLKNVTEERNLLNHYKMQVNLQDTVESHIADVVVKLDILKAQSRITRHSRHLRKTGNTGNSKKTDGGRGVDCENMRNVNVILGETRGSLQKLCENMRYVNTKGVEKLIPWGTWGRKGSWTMRRVWATTFSFTTFNTITVVRLTRKTNTVGNLGEERVLDHEEDKRCRKTNTVGNLGEERVLDHEEGLGHHI
ncbi:hypothetical protein Bca4012_009668 [Brassica carinata]